MSVITDQEEVRRLRTEVLTLRELLQTFHQTQLQQAQALNAYLSSSSGGSHLAGGRGIGGLTLNTGLSRPPAGGSNMGGLLSPYPVSPTTSQTVAQFPPSTTQKAPAAPLPAVPLRAIPQELPELKGQEQAIRRAVTLRRRPVPVRTAAPPEATPPGAVFDPNMPIPLRASRPTTPLPKGDSRRPSLAPSIVPSRAASRAPSRSRPPTRSQSRPPTPDLEQDIETKYFVECGAGNITTEDLQKQIANARDQVFSEPIGSQEEALQNLVGSDYFVAVPSDNVPGEDFWYELSRYMHCAGPKNPEQTVTVRDYYTMPCDKVVNYEIENDQDLWQFLARARAEGGRAVEDGGDETITEFYQKVNGRVGSLEGDGTGEYPAYGREIVVENLTPNIALILMSIANHIAGEAYAQPLNFLDNAFANALMYTPTTFYKYDREYKRWSFLFTATFFELDEFDDDPTARRGLISYPQSGFGPKLHGPFYPAKKDSPFIYQNTLSLVFDCLSAENGSYWTIVTAGTYEDEKAFAISKDIRFEQAPKYTAPEEVLLDKLARIIDYVVDDGIADVLRKMNHYLNIPSEALFSKEESEKLLFDDIRFSRTKSYHWAMQWLNKMAECMKALVVQLDEFERVHLDNFRATANAHRKRAGIPLPLAKLSCEATYFRKVDRARKVYERVLAKQEEVKDLRDALVNASGVLESRAAVNQADTVYVLTVLMVIYLPITTVIGVFGMDFLPDSSQRLGVFLICLGSVLLGTSLLGLTLSSILASLSRLSGRIGNNLQRSMKALGGSWKSRSFKLQEFSEAEKIIEQREEKIAAGWYYIWYALTWMWVIFPAKEVRQIGGIRGLGNVVGGSAGGTNQIDWLWDIAAVPFRVLLVPLHILALGFVYIFLVVFGTGLVGKKPEEIGSTVPRDAAEKKETPTERTELLEKKDATAVTIEEKSTAPDPKPRSRWITRFTNPLVILDEFSEAGSHRPGTSKLEQRQQDIDTPDVEGWTEEERARRDEFYNAIAQAVQKAKEKIVGDEDDEATDKEDDDDDDAAEADGQGEAGTGDGESDNEENNAVDEDDGEGAGNRENDRLMPESSQLLAGGSLFSVIRTRPTWEQERDLEKGV